MTRCAAARAKTPFRAATVTTVSSAKAPPMSCAVAAAQTCFVYSALIHSAAISDGDYIGDFERGLDQIDLSDLITGPVQFLGAGTNVASGSANLGYVSYGGNAGLRVLLDVEGDGTADLMFRVADATELTATDFIL
ncbi:hypothetical protein GQR58_000178 [Nymphon striatum]|nr:hypothetical protein GQR58_000178 [Nymphon striatum]